MKNDFLSQILDQQARARLNTLAMTKPDKAKAVENMLVNMARTRGMSGQVFYASLLIALTFRISKYGFFFALLITDEQLRNMLNDIASHTKKPPEVKFDRRRAAIDSDDDF
ncbi:unnamed protein product [Hydatigera taeniaeformis]|uniref:Plasmid stability protein n=1 Tax=Hydatigena taeniaeformis TaxID=6205 RepID=A0A0R3WPW8_HYDTA|nr:unnamed protein product [Hydatigera taeniaeformis]